jgi:hypothetical protein
MADRPADVRPHYPMADRPADAHQHSPAVAHPAVFLRRAPAAARPAAFLRHAPAAAHPADVPRRSPAAVPRPDAVVAAADDAPSAIAGRTRAGRDNSCPNTSRWRRSRSAARLPCRSSSPAHWRPDTDS